MGEVRLLTTITETGGLVGVYGNVNDGSAPISPVALRAMNGGEWSDPRAHGEMVHRDTWNDTTALTVEMGGVELSGTENMQGYREDRVIVPEYAVGPNSGESANHVTETRSTEGENTCVIDVQEKDGESTYYSRDFQSTIRRLASFRSKMTIGFSWAEAEMHGEIGSGRLTLRKVTSFLRRLPIFRKARI